MQANMSWDGITTDPYTVSSFAERVMGAARDLARTPNSIRGGFRDKRHTLTGFIDRGRELIALDDRLAAFRPVSTVAAAPVNPLPTPTPPVP
ncbi:MAG: hypothetical protein EBQ56_00110, partial [Proteobacteria bacterium]|nr:hypothetical protein [Pseudomonadota bacterium]